MSNGKPRPEAQQGYSKVFQKSCSTHFSKYCTEIARKGPQGYRKVFKHPAASIFPSLRGFHEERFSKNADETLTKTQSSCSIYLFHASSKEEARKRTENRLILQELFFHEQRRNSEEKRHHPAASIFSKYCDEIARKTTASCSISLSEIAVK